MLGSFVESPQAEPCVRRNTTPRVATLRAMAATRAASVRARGRRARGKKGSCVRRPFHRVATQRARGVARRALTQHPRRQTSGCSRSTRGRSRARSPTGSRRPRRRRAAPTTREAGAFFFVLATRGRRGGRPPSSAVAIQHFSSRRCCSAVRWSLTRRDTMNPRGYKHCRFPSC